MPSFVQRHRQALALILASLLSNAPLWFTDPGMDVLTHLVSISCFSEQFWQGNVYPRWCFSANFSFGSPHLLIYYPLAYFASALLYPLHALLGVSLKNIFVLGVLPPTLCAAFGARLWLTPVAGGRQATLAAMLFLFLPYRQELMFTRCAISELWCIGLAPFFCHYARLLAHGRQGAAWPLGFIIALLLLSNVPAALGVLLAGGIYMLFYARQQRVLLAWFGVAMLLGMVLSSPYWLPAMEYVHLLNHQSSSAAVNVNTYVTRVFHGPYALVLLCSVALTLLAFMHCAGALLRQLWRTPPSLRVQQAEGVRWLLIGCVLVVSLFPVSALFWHVVNSYTLIGFPWRMQLALCLCIIFLFAVSVRPRSGDVVALACLLLLMPPLFLVQFDSGQGQKITEILDTRAMIAENYRPLTAKPEYYNWYWYRRVAQQHPLPAEVVAGECKVAVGQWGWREISLTVSAQRGCSVRLHHLFFPLWRLQDGGEGMALMPENNTGLMLVRVPGGEHTVVIRPLSTLQMMREAL